MVVVIGPVGTVENTRMRAWRKLGSRCGQNNVSLGRHPFTCGITPVDTNKPAIHNSINRIFHRFSPAKTNRFFLMPGKSGRWKARGGNLGTERACAYPCPPAIRRESSPI